MERRKGKEPMIPENDYAELSEREKEAAEALLLLSVTTPAAPTNMIIITDNHNNYLLPPNNLSFEHSSIGDDEIKQENTCYNDQYYYYSSDDDEMIDPKVVIVKELQPTDVDSHQNRLSMPASRIFTKKFLTETEEEALKNHSKIEVKVTGGLSDKEYKMLLGIWQYHGNGFSYVLNGSWSQFREDNGLKEKETIRIVSFRTKGHLCIHIKVLYDPGSWGRTRIRGSNNDDLKKLKKLKTC